MLNIPIIHCDIQLKPLAAAYSAAQFKINLFSDQNNEIKMRISAQTMCEADPRLRCVYFLFVLSLKTSVELVY